MKSITLDQETENGLRRAAGLTGKTEPEILRAAVAAYVEELEDAGEADRILDRIQAGTEQSLTLDELDRRLELDG